MNIFVLPVSGGGFVTQLAILQHLCESNIHPNITLASSGGNVAAYIAEAAQWKWAAIERIARKLSQDLFVSSWSNIAFMSTIIGYFQGNIFNKGTGVHNFLNEHFTEQTIRNDEIWTGTYNKNKKQARLFCNKFREESMLDISCIDHDLSQSMEVVFADGKIDLIAKYGSASASIPAIVPSVNILEEEYVDGGVASASPLAIMQEPILKYIEEHDAPMHIIYINSVDLSTHPKKETHNVLDTVKEATSNMVRSSTVSDRLAAYKLLRYHSGIMYKEEFLCTYDNIERVKLLYNTVKYSMLEIYPKGIFSINITKFNGEDVAQAMHKAYDQLACRFWWLSSENSSETLETLSKMTK